LLIAAGVILLSVLAVLPAVSVMLLLLLLLMRLLMALPPFDYCCATCRLPHYIRLQSCCQSAAGVLRLQAALKGYGGVWLQVLPAVGDTFARLQHLYFLSPGQDLGM
jgi:hypothetical protein